MKKKKRRSASKKFVTAYIAIMAIVTIAYIVLAYIAVYRAYNGGLYWLQWPITARDAAGAIILTAYFSKSKAVKHLVRINQCNRNDRYLCTDCRFKAAGFEIFYRIPVMIVTTFREKYKTFSFCSFF